MMILPVTSCDSEQSVLSVLCMHKVKTYLHTTMSQERLNGLALLNVYNSTTYIPSTMKIRTEFLKKHKCHFNGIQFFVGS